MRLTTVSHCFISRGIQHFVWRFLGVPCEQASAGLPIRDSGEGALQQYHGRVANWSRQDIHSRRCHVQFPQMVSV